MNGLAEERRNVAGLLQKRIPLPSRRRRSPQATASRDARGRLCPLTSAPESPEPSMRRVFCRMWMIIYVRSLSS